MIQTLKLEEDNRTEEEINVNRSRIEGAHQAIKDIIRVIELIENIYESCGFIICREFIDLKNKLGVMVYKDWHIK